MANLGLIELKIGLYIKVNVNAGQKNLKSISTNLPKMAFNWHKIGNFSSNFDVLFFQNACFLKTNRMVTISIQLVFALVFAPESHMGSIARLNPKLPLKCSDVSWPSPLTPNSKSFFSKVIGLNPPPPPPPFNSTSKIV